MFDRFVMVDWSGGNDRGPRPKRDAIWIGEAGQRPLYQRNRLLTEETLTARIETGLSSGERLLIGFDFPFGYPAGFAAALTGRADPFAVWHWLAERIEDAPKANNRFDVAGAVNRALGQGIGPFWGNGLRRDIDGLPRRKKGYVNPFDDKRAAEKATKGTFTCWQLSGAGAVGSQVLMGLPVLHRLRARFPGRVAVWPFERLEAPVAFVEIWPSLLSDAVRARSGPGDIRDAVQVRVMADALAALSEEALARMLKSEATEEGSILGLGHEALLRGVA